MTPQKPFKLPNLIKIGPRWACQNLWGHGRMILVKVGPWGMLYGPSYDHFCVCYVDPHFPNIEDFEVYGGICGYMTLVDSI